MRAALMDVFKSHNVGVTDPGMVASVHCEGSWGSERFGDRKDREGDREAKHIKIYRDLHI